jgi:hypothetical protein
MFDELVKSIRLQLSERLTSPLLGSFVVSWCAWNYKALVILFSKEPVEHSFYLLQTIVWPDQTMLLARGLLAPSLTAAAYIFVYPYPAKFVYEFSRKRQREILDVRRRIEEETPLTVAESKEIRRQIYESQLAAENEVAHKNNEIVRLKERVEELEKQLSERQAPVVVNLPRKVKAATTSQLQVLQRLAGAMRPMLYSELIQEFKDRVRLDFDLQELVTRSMISREADQAHREYKYTVSHEGRRVLLDEKDNEDVPY